MTTATVQCPHCQEDIRAGANVCPHCRRRQPGAPNPVLKVLLIAMAVLVGGFFLLVAIGSNTDHSPEAQLARIKESCDRQYGSETLDSGRCQVAIIGTRLQENEDRKLRRAVEDAR